MSIPRIRIRFSLTIGDEMTSHSTPLGPDTEAQIGTHHETGYVETGLGFYPPSATTLEDE